MTEHPLKILLVEDDASDAFSLCAMLREQISASIDVKRTASMGEAERYLAAHAVDIVVLDLGLPDTQGVEAVRRACAAAPHVPMVVLTDLDDESLAMQALKEGAQDYFVKGKVEPSTLYRAMRYAIERKAMEKELRRARDRAERAETLLRDAVDSLSEGLVIYDREDRFVMCNEAYRRTYPANVDLLVPGAHYEDVIRDGLAKGGSVDARSREPEWLAARLRFHREATGAFEHHLRDGFWVLASDRRMKNGGIVGLRIDISALKQTQEALRKSESHLGRAQKIAHIGSWELNSLTGIQTWSKEMYRIHGVSSEDFQPDMTNFAAYVHPDDDPLFRSWFADLIEGHEQTACEARIVRPDGKTRLLRVDGRAVANPDGVSHRFAGTMQDITDRRMIEQQLAQAQKMEAIGNLTGGMAHDFNNGLGVIIGNLDLLRRLITADPTATELCDEARGGALRCADLIRQLLAFARRQPLRPRRIDVNALAETTVNLLRRTLGEHITLCLQPGASLCPVMADSVQLQVALTNLANNARDAMPKGGRLTITTKMIDLDTHYAALHPEVSPGAYVMIEVSDNGAGMTADVLANVFEPFFTTKGPGQGTGLGLSMVFGFVRQSGGHVTVSSEPGQGSTFRIYLPCVPDAGAEIDTRIDGKPVVGGDETVLVVEDNARLRKATVRQLETLGYRVREAEQAAAALAVLATEDRVDMLFTDVVMPGTIDGIALAHQALRLHPALKVLLSSGFSGTRDAAQNDGSAFPLLSKPYRYDELARAVRMVLDTDRERTSARAAIAADQSLHDGNPAVPAKRV
jgi:PAS domain S-box-containing protein